MPSQAGLAAQRVEQATVNNTEEVLEAIRDAEGRPVRISSPGMSCRMRYAGLEQTSSGVVPKYEFYLASMTAWFPCVESTAKAVLGKHGPYTWNEESDG